MSASEEEDNPLIDEDPADENNASSSDESESGDSVVNSPIDGGEKANEEEEGDRETVQSGEGVFPGEGSDGEVEEEEDEMASAVASASAQASKFISEAVSEEEEGDGEELGTELQSREGEKEGEANSEEEEEGERVEEEGVGQQTDKEEGEKQEQPEQESDTEEVAGEVDEAEGDVEGEGEDTPTAVEAGDDIEEDSPFRDIDEEEASPPAKKQKLDEAEEIDSGSEGGEEGEAGEGGEELSELQQEVADLEEQEEGPTDTSEVTVGRVNLGEEEEEGSEDEVEDRNRDVVGVSDWDLMMQRRKEAMARARKRRRKDIDINASDDFIMNLIGGMKVAAQEDKQLNLAGKAATKKLQMLPTVMSHLKNGDLQTAFIECGILTALAEWLTPLPDHSLPHLKIRTSILDTLSTYPTPDSSILKSSKIGKAVMLLYRHPKESRKNREKAGKLVNEWARPIFGVASDMKSLSRDKREERDYANLSQAARRRLSSSGERRTSQDEEYQPQKPGDKGWVGRARVPMPSTKDYVVRPKWNVEQEFKRGPTKKVLNRYEEHLRKKKQAKQQSKATHAVSISIEGRRMPL